MKKLFLLLIITIPYSLYSQVRIGPYVSSGYIKHLGRTGFNFEYGIEAEFFKRLDISINYRHTKATRDIGNDVTISGVSSNISFIIVNRNNHRLMLGPGLTYGRYQRYTDYLGLDNHYKDVWFDYVKLRYDYTILSRIRVGAIISLPGDDRDGSTFLGLLLGYRF